MRILDDGPADAGAHEFAVELDPDDAQAGERWESAADKGEYGVPHAMVRCEGRKIDPAALRASLERFRSARRRLAMDGGGVGGVPAARRVRRGADRLAGAPGRRGRDVVGGETPRAWIP